MLKKRQRLEPEGKSGAGLGVPATGKVVRSYRQQRDRRSVGNSYVRVLAEPLRKRRWDLLRSALSSGSWYIEVICVREILG